MDRFIDHDLVRRATSCTDCAATVTQTMVSAAASVGTAHNRSTDEVLRAYLARYHADDHTRVHTDCSRCGGRL